MKLTKIQKKNIEHLYINKYEGVFELTKEYWLQYEKDLITIYQWAHILDKNNNIDYIFEFIDICL